MKKNETFHFLFYIFWYQDQENGFKASIYHKPTFSGVYSNFSSFISEPYKIGLIFTLLFRTFPIVSDFSRFHTEVLRKNLFPTKLVDNCIKTFFNKKFLHTLVALTVEKKELFITLTYLGNLSIAIRTGLQIVLTKIFLFVRSRLFFILYCCLQILVW